jgi:hypothetical protein
MYSVIYIHGVAGFGACLEALALGRLVVSSGEGAAAPVVLGLLPRGARLHLRIRSM